MQNVLLLHTRQAHALDLRGIRNEYGLSLLQAAIALRISASALEDLERSGDPKMGGEEIRRRYELFVGTNAPEGKNLIFGHYPLRMAREILGVSVEEIAAANGYTANTWKRIEANARPLRRDILQKIECQVRDKFKAVCAAVA